MGRAKGKNSTASKENTDPKTPAPKSRVSSEKPQSKNPSKSANNSSAPEKLPRRRAIFSEDDDRVMITVLLEQKLEGMASDNGGWKKPAINAVVVALEGSELTSGGSPKTFRSVQDHYSKLKNDYRVFKELASISGWGWDPENHRVQASEEQWNTYLAAHPNMEKYKNMTFPLYEDMDELLDGALATGKAAFCAGGSDSEQESGNDTDGPDHDSESDSEPILSASKVPIEATPTPLKRKISARESAGMSVKRSRRDRSGGSKISTASAISQMSSAVEQMAAAFSVGETSSSGSGDSLLARAVKLLEKEEFLTTMMKARLMQVVRKDTAFAELILSVTEIDTRRAIYELNLD